MNLWHGKLSLDKVLLSLPQPPRSRSFSIDKPAPKAQNTSNYKTAETVPMKTVQHAYRRLPDIHIQSGEKKSLEVLLERGDIEPATDLVTRDTKVILWYSSTRYHPVLSRLHPLRGCPESRCRVTTNRGFYTQSDALVFTAQLLDRMPPVKLPNQVWILHNHESPQWVNKHTYLYTESWSSTFNWTMDYRNDADVKAPYGIFEEWNISYGYIRGGCGNHKCPRSDDEACMEYLSKNYKFYLAFENALCKDYISEKFFRYFNSDMLLVTRGGATTATLLPKEPSSMQLISCHLIM
ncbi:alpha-(1,3)-fucosyltransferase fut-6-like [Haliotis rubra]|uniref:alpha-(1,3)-fucosyltransferase fut-6-like n=1 Tax=Haliotis rubra TaxID=36100 RepID=UPI001EE55DE6|nr:alpha-(1,3)-fucosyltransferase fut-6-like [Haliotis rubra]